MESTNDDYKQVNSTLEHNNETITKESKKYVIEVKEKIEEEGQRKHPHQPPFKKMVTKLLPTDRYEGHSEFDNLFRNEDKTLTFARDTFFEEFFVHILHAFIGPILLPLYKKICTVGGLKITGFMKSRLPKGTTNYGFYDGELKRFKFRNRERF